MDLSVIIPTHNPHPERLRRTLAALHAQTLSPARWETIVVNNASTTFPGATFFTGDAPARIAIIDEPSLGLSAARRRGFAAAKADVAVLVDDDNLLASDYLAEVLAIFGRAPTVGVAGGRSVPEFERAP